MKVPFFLRAGGVLAISVTAFDESSTFPSASVTVPSPGSNPGGNRKNSPPVGPLPAVEEDKHSATSTCSSEGICVDDGPNADGKDVDGKNRGQYYCVEDNPVNVREYKLANTLNCFHDAPGDETELVGDFVTPKLEPGQLAPILWRDSTKVSKEISEELNSTISLGGKIVTQYAYQIGLPPKLTSTLLEYCNSTGIIDAFRKFTLPESQGGEPIAASTSGHNGKFIELLDGNRWYAQRPAKEWKSNMHWISPADEKTHEEYLRVLGKGDFDLVLKSIGEQLGLDGLVAYHLTFIGVSESVRGFVHHDTKGTGGSVYNVIIPLLLEEDVDPELILVDDKYEKKGGFKYSVGVASMMGDDAMHGTLECDYLNIRSKHFEDGKLGGMRLAATVYIADVNEQNVDAITTETLTQIFPLADEKWLMSQRGRHWRVEGGYSIAYDKGRKKFRFEDEYDDCDNLVKAGMCESDTEDTRVKCLKSCHIYIEEGPSSIRIINGGVYDNKDNKVEVCAQNRTGVRMCKIYADDSTIPGDFITPPLGPGEIFPILWRNDSARRTTDYAFQIGLPPELTSELLSFCNRLGITDLFRSLVGDDPIKPDKDDHTGKFFELTDGNRWYAQRPAKYWTSNMHWVSPADEKTHEEYLKVLAKGNFDMVLDALGKYLGLEGLVAYHLTFIGVSHSEKGFMHRDTYGTGAAVYNVIIPLILVDDALPELAIGDYFDEDLVGTLKYKVGTAAMMGDEAMHGTEACDYRQHKGLRMAATVYIADINEVNVNAISEQTLTQIFPLPDTSWLMAQRSRHWDGIEGANSLSFDKGRKPFWFHDKLDDCEKRATRGMCESDISYTRTKCLRSCKIYESNIRRNRDGEAAYMEICSIGDAENEGCRWTTDSELSRSLILPELQLGEVYGVYWKQNGKKALPNSYQLAIPPSLSMEISKFCLFNDFIQLYQSFRFNDQGEFTDLADGNRWHAIKRDIDLVSFSPADEIAHESFLNVLAEGDFDNTLDTIGSFFQLEGLAVYKISIVAYAKGGKYLDNLAGVEHVYDIIIPLILPKGKPVVFSIEDDGSNIKGDFNLGYGMGLALGDAIRAFEGHGMSEDVFFAASISIADIREDNIDAIFEQTSFDSFPHPNKDYIWAQEGRHWGYSGTLWDDIGGEPFEVIDKLEDCAERAHQGLCEVEVTDTRLNCPIACGVFLPSGISIKSLGWNSDGASRTRLCIKQTTRKLECKIFTEIYVTNDNTFLSPSLDSNDLFPITSKENMQFDPKLWKFGLPVGLSNTLISYIENNGIYDELRHLLYDDLLDAGSGILLTLGTNDKKRYYVERLSADWESNEHIIYPADEKTHEDLLRVLAEGNFDHSLDRIGKIMGLNHIAVYHVAFTAMSNAANGDISSPYTIPQSGSKAFSAIVPLFIPTENRPSTNVLVVENADGMRGGVNFEKDIGVIIGDSVKHASPECDLRAMNGIQLAAIVYFAEIDEESAQAIISSLDHLFPPPDEVWLYAQVKRHWGGRNNLRNNPGRLPLSISDEIYGCHHLVDEGKCDTDYEEVALKCLRSCLLLKDYIEGSYVEEFFKNLPKDDATCVDQTPECQVEANNGLCMTDKTHMEEKGCHYSCLYCLAPTSASIFSMGESQLLEVDPDDDDWQEDSTDDASRYIPTEGEIIDVMTTAEEYMVNVVLMNEEYSHVRLSCRNYDEKCSYWAAQGHCEDAAGWMGKHCAAACLNCLMIDPENRCPIDYNSNVMGPGDLSIMFERWLAESGQDPSLFSIDNPPNGTYDHPFGKLSVISSPYDDMEKLLTEEEKGSDEEFQPLPWVVSIDGFLSEEECQRLIEYGSTQGYERSSAYSSETSVDGFVDFLQSDTRTSMNSWCQDECAADPLITGVIRRMVQMTGISAENYEDLQLVRYENGQYYQQHHDFAQNHARAQYGPRLLTFFLYLNDLSDEQGGGTKFDHLKFTAKPQRGMALIWPSVTNEDPYEMDEWTWHEALPVSNAVKYGANAWIHMRNYQDVEEYCRI